MPYFFSISSHLLSLLALFHWKFVGLSPGSYLHPYSEWIHHISFSHCTLKLVLSLQTHYSYFSFFFFCLLPFVLPFKQVQITVQYPQFCNQFCNLYYSHPACLLNPSHFSVLHSLCAVSVISIVISNVILLLSWNVSSSDRIKYNKI